MILPSPCNTSPFQGTWRDFLAQIVRAAVAAAGRTTLCFYMICPESCVMRCFTWRRSDTPGNNLEIAQRATNTSRRCLVQGPCVVPFGGRLYCRCSLSFVFLGGARCLKLSPCNISLRTHSQDICNGGRFILIQQEHLQPTETTVNRHHCLHLQLQLTDRPSTGHHVKSSQRIMSHHCSVTQRKSSSCDRLWEYFAFCAGVSGWSMTWFC